MNCVILQPSYIPWRGFFHQVQKADVFVFYDDVQYDDRGWRNRNRIKTGTRPQWLTIPVLGRGAQVEMTPIHEVPICWDRPWARKHLTAGPSMFRASNWFRPNHLQRCAVSRKPIATGQENWGQSSAGLARG